MASSLLLLPDDIAGVIGDELALNAKQVTGVATARELPVVWAVARGSVIDKAILVPVALALGWLAALATAEGVVGLLAGGLLVGIVETGRWFWHQRERS